MPPDARRSLRVALERLPPFVPCLAAALFGLGIFLFGFDGLRIVNPARVTWMVPGTDYAFHHAGWVFYRHAEWSLWPLGDIPDFQYPAGTTVGFMDGIPWVAVPMKLLAPLLPEHWQYIGPWLCLCFTLQGWFGARLAQAIAPRVAPITAALAGALFVISPILYFRLVHEALCGHFLLLADIALCVRPGRRFPRAAPLILTTITAGVHVYLTAMVVPLTTAALIRAWRAGAIRRATSAAALALANVAIVVVLFWWMGFFSTGSQDLGGGGFGIFTTDLLAPLNPDRFSWILPTRPKRPGVSFEDLGYVGLGGILLGASGLVLLVAGRLRREPPLPWRKAAPLIVACGLMALYAASPKIAVYGHVLVDLTPLYRPFEVVTGSLRMAGRFIWPTTYVLVAGGIGVWALRRPRVAPFALAIALVAQMADLKNMIFKPPWRGSYPVRRWSPDWDLARGDFRHLALYPPRCADSSYLCCGKELSRRPDPRDVFQANLATRVGLTLNSGGSSRARRTVMLPYCEKLFADVAAGRLDPRTIYWVAKDKEEGFRRANPYAVCKKLDGELACVSYNSRGAFRDRLAEPPAR